MSYTLKLGTFTKYVESTKQPTVTGWTQYDINFKDGTDVVNPTITLSIDYSTVKAYNYAYMLDRYYWIEKMTMLRTGLCELKLKTDVLATYKSDIGSASLYVLRAASSYDGNITDNFYPMKNSVEYITETQTPFTTHTYNTGCIILNIAGSQTTGNNTLYQLTPDNFRILIKNLYDNIDGFQLADVINSVVKSFGGNPEKLINGAMWFPDTIMPADAPDVNVFIGSWDSGVSGKRVTAPIYTDVSYDFTISVHPQVSTRGRYLNLSPYSRYLLFLPGVGVTNLDTTRLSGINKITATRMVDAITGRATYIVKTKPDNLSDPVSLLLVAETQWGVPMTLSGNNSGNSIINGTLNTVGAAALAVATGGAGAIIGAVTAGIGTLAGAMEGQTCGSNTGGNTTTQLNPMRLDTVFVYVTNDDLTHNGRPLMQTKTISTLSGYIQVQKGDVDISGTLPEEEEIKRYLETGFYYE